MQWFIATRDEPVEFNSELYHNAVLLKNDKAQQIKRKTK